MQLQQNILDCYNKAAANYANQFIDELSHKHLDRILLQSFAKENAAKGKMIDLGCGPGQTTRFLVDAGVKDIIGADLSPQMISEAKKINPTIEFDTADMLQLKYGDASFGSAVAFYAIVHFDYEQIAVAFKKINRVLKNGGEFLFSFHVGEETVHLDNFLEQEVNIDFYFLNVEKIVNILTQTGFEIVDVIERRPYKEVEHQSRRGYVWVKKTENTKTPGP